MIKKILLCCMGFMLLFSGLVFSDEKEKDEKVVRLGLLTHLGTTQDEFQEGFDRFRSFLKSSEPFSGLINEAVPKSFISSLVNEHHVIYFYDSLMSSLMSLRAGKIDEFVLPESVGEYILSQNKSYEVRFSTNVLTSKISFGFREDNTELKEKFDKILKEMKSDGTLEVLCEKYISDFKISGNKSIKPQEFKDAPVIRVAVTGDMPPVDMFAGDGKPAGFNTAVLAEMGRRLECNIEFVNVSSAARSSALFSGRVDVVFWYATKEDTIESNDLLQEVFNDVPAGVILSVPYYSWDKEFIIRAAKSGGLWGIFSR